SLDDFPCEARDIAGIVGYEFIKEFVVEIDYQTRILKLSDSVGYRYQGGGEMLPLTIKRTPRAHASVKLPGQQAIEGLFEIDTGSEVSLIINPPFVKQQSFLEPLSSRLPANGRGVGGESHRVAARLSSLQLGHSTIPSPVVSFSIDSEGALNASDNDGP